MKAFSIFFGLIVALAGVNMILRAIFHISIPFFRILIGILFIYVGISFLIHKPMFFRYKSVSGYDGHSKYDMLFTSSKFDFATVDTSSSANTFEINTLFSTSTIDLTSIENQSNVKTVEINTIFGQSTIYILENAKINIYGSSAFGESILPNNERVAFGEIVRKNTDTNSTIDIKVNSIFGQSKIEYKR